MKVFPGPGASAPATESGPKTEAALLARGGRFLVVADIRRYPDRM